MSGIYTETKLLLHCNGTNGSTTFTDSSGTGKTVTANGNAQLTTTNPKFGTACALFDGTGDTLSIPSSTDFDFGSGLFTIDNWVNFTSLKNCGIWEGANATSGYALAYNNTSHTLSFGNYSSGWTILFNCSWTPSTSTWYHLAVVHVNTDNAASAWRIFIDGVSQTLTKTAGNWNGAVNSYSHGFKVGTDDIIIGGDLDGRIDELRLNNGLVVWNSDFTPPTSEYSSSTTSIKKINGVDYASVKKVEGVAIASTKKYMGVA